MSQFHGGPVPPQQPGPFQPAPPKKSHTVRNVVIGITVGIFALIAGCTALVGGALSSVDTSSEPSGVVTTVDTGPSPDPVVIPTNKPTKVPHSVPPKPAPTKTAPKLTAGQEQAIGSAEDYLATGAFSRKGLIEQLSSSYGEGFSKADATYAVDHITVNWNEQAAKAARGYLQTQHFSRKGLIQQLESTYGEGFTHAQAVYGVNKAGL